MELRKIFWLAAIFSAQCFAQQTMAPFKTQQINTTYYVGQSNLTTIQKAVTEACASSPGGRVLIAAGITPPDTIGSVTGGCTKAPIVDQRSLPDACYTWSGSAYAVGACASGTGGAPAGAFSDVQTFATSSTFGADSGNFQNNSTTHNLHQKQLNGIPYAGNYSTGGSTGIPNAFAALPGGAGVIINDQENASDATLFGASEDSTIIDEHNGGLGHRLHGCILNPALPNDQAIGGACMIDWVYWDQPFTPDGRGGIPFKGNVVVAEGPGYNNGNTGLDSGWAIDGGQFIQQDSFRAGISYAIAIQNNKYSPGDSENIESRQWCWGGNEDISGEFCRNIQVQGGQQPFYPTGTITTTTGTGDVRPVTSAQHVPAGSSMIDTSLSAVAGSLTGAGTTLWAESTYLSLLPMTAVLTPSTGSCIMATQTHSSTVAGTPQSVSFTCTAGSLGAIVPGVAWAASNNALLEEVTITAVSGTAVTMLAANSHDIGSNIIQGGTHGCISFDANLAATGWRSCYYAFGARDSTHLIYGYLAGGSMNGHTIPSPGNEAETTTSGVHIYPMARVAYVNSLGASVTLMANDVAWANGHNIEFVPNPAVNIFSLGWDATIMSPVNSNGSYGFLGTYAGPGVTGNYQPFNLRNGNPDSMYSVHGGWASLPNAEQILGPHGNDFLIGEAPNESIISVLSDFGIDYGVVSSGGGVFGVDPPNTRYFFSQGLLVSGPLTATGVNFINGYATTGANTFTGTQSINANVFAPLIITSNNVFGTTIEMHNSSNSTVWQFGAEGSAEGTNFGFAFGGGPFVFGISSSGGISVAGSQYTTGLQGTTGTKLFACTGAFTASHFVSTDANGNCVDGGAVPSIVTGVHNDILTFDVSGNPADSGQLITGVTFTNAANQFGNFTQTFGLTGSGQVQMGNADAVGINTSSVTTWTLNNFTGNIDGVSYSVGGAAGVTKTCTALPTVAGGIITSC